MVAAGVTADARGMTNVLPAPPAMHDQPGRRTGATWVAATGAFLLLAGAAVFVAVQWDRLPDSAKLGLVVALTGAFLAAGRRLRRTLPATGDVLFHLGAFLVPIDVAGVGAHAGIGWRQLLLAEGLAGVVALGGLGLATRSVVLRWAGTASAVVLAAGVAAVSAVPAAVVLATAALLADVTAARLRAPRSSDARLAATTWAAVAGLAPLLVAAASVIAPLGSGALAELGLTTALASAAAAVLAAAVLARQAGRDRDLTLAFLALASLAVGALSTCVAAHLPSTAVPVALASAFVVAEGAALLTRRDPFWHRPLEVVADVAEVTAAVLTLPALAFLAGAPLLDPFPGVDPRPVLGTALAVAALGWLTADVRRYRGTPRPLILTLVRGSGWAPATVPLAVSVVVAVECATASGLATGVALVATAGLLLAAHRPLATVVAALGIPWAVAAAATHPVAGAALGLAGAAVLVGAAVQLARADTPSSPLAVVPALLAVATALLAIGVAAPEFGLAAAAATAVAACWLLALALDRGSHKLGDLARAAMLVPVAASLGVAPALGVPIAVGAVLLFVVDALRLDRPAVAAGSALAVQAVIVNLTRANGLDVAATGLALCVGSVAWTGLAAVVDGRWQLPFTVAAATGLTAGLWATSVDPATLATALLVVGALAVGSGLFSGRPWLSYVGATVAIFGIWSHLVLGGVIAAEPYLLPVCVLLVVAGSHARHDNPLLSSWVAYAPPVALLGGAALAERLAEGAGWHAVVAGAVGVAAVVAGGWGRLVGPMSVGTVLLVALTVSESLSALAGVPTWAWLVGGGAVLLTAGIALERSDTSPVEAGRRIVDIVGESFS